MKDPPRLITDPNTPDEHRALLQQGIGIEPPADAESHVWRSLSAVVGAAAAGTAASTGASLTAKAAPIVGGLAMKKVVVIAAGALALASAGGLTWRSMKKAERSQLPAAPAMVAHTSVPPQAPIIQPLPPLTPPPSEAVVPTPPSTPATAPAPLPPQHHNTRASRPQAVAAAPRPAVEAARPRAQRAIDPSHLREETDLVKSARRAMRAGDAAGALEILNESRRRFPSAVLEQERERLTIEALVATGQAQEAAARAAEFLRQYPDSPHAAEVRTLVSK